MRPWPASHLHMPLSSRRTVTRPHALLSQSKCTDKESLRILVPSNAKRECHYSGERCDQNENTFPQIMLPSPRHYSGALLSRRAVPVIDGSTDPRFQ